MEEQENNKETSYIVCKHCKQEKIRTFVSYYPNNKDKRWIDAKTGREFNGRLCPPCDSEKKSRNKKLLRRLHRIQDEAVYDNSEE